MTAFRDVLVNELIRRFPGERLRVGVPPRPLAVFAARHPDVGEATIDPDHVLPPALAVRVAVGRILVDSFHSCDDHLDRNARERRLTADVVRFLQELFADRLLIWRSIDGRGAGWRERGDGGHTEPLVLDNRIYERYLWSGPLPSWQAIPAILAKGQIRDDREYAIVSAAMSDPAASGIEGRDLETLSRLAAVYRGDHAD